MRNCIILIALLAVAACAAEPTPPHYVMNEEDRAVTALYDVQLDPGQQFVRCRSGSCYDVYTGVNIEMDPAPNGYMLISGTE